MPSSQYTYEPAPDPLAPAEELLHWLTSATVHLTLGLALGLLAARAMRGRQLRWSWAAVGLGAVVIGHVIIGRSLASILGTAALVAALRGRRWHREDVDAGADLAALAVASSGPLDALRRMAGWAARQLGQMPDREMRSPSGRLMLGYDGGRHPVTIPLGTAAGGAHALVLGATRSGKTVTMTWIAVNAIGRGMGAIVIDPKGDGDLRLALREAASAAGRPFLEWTPSGPSIYNPYARGSETEIADKALAGERFTEPHYLRQAQRYLGHEIRVLRRAGVEVSLRALVEYLDTSELEVLARGLSENEALSAHRYLDSLTPRQRLELTGVRDRLAILAESDVGSLLDPDTAGIDRIDLLEAMRARSIVYFSLESDRRPLLAQMLGAAIVQDLQTAVAVLQERPAPTLVAIDEFAAIAPERIVGLFARAGGAGISLVLGTQEFADLRLPGAERVRDQIVGNLSTLISHRQAVPASAELVASMTETVGAWRTSRHGDGGLTRTRTFEHVLRAQQITSLSQGCAAVIDLAGGGRASIARIRSPHRGR
jgi:conjugal transfer pilus assembly protein TraD